MTDQHEHLPPQGYVQAHDVPTHGDSIADGVTTVKIAAGAYPAIIRALNLIREDNGGPAWPPESEPLIAARWQPHLMDIEDAIAILSDDTPAPEDVDAKDAPFDYTMSEVYSFCNGEDTVMSAIASRSPALGIANRFLCDFFEGWSWYSDEGFDPTAAPVTTD